MATTWYQRPGTNVPVDDCTTWLLPDVSLKLAYSVSGPGPAQRWTPHAFPLLYSMIGPPPSVDEPRNLRVKDLSEKIADLCARLDVPYFDSYAPLFASKTWMPCVNAVDGTHPSAAGYSEWALAIGEWPAWREWLP